MLKNTIAFILVLTLSLGLFSHHASADPLVYGDVDVNGQINAMDALVILKCSVGKYEISELLIKYADVNNDSDINASDALLVLRKSVGKLTKFPAEPYAPDVSNMVLKDWLLEYGEVHGSDVVYTYAVDDYTYRIIYSANNDNISVSSWLYEEGDYGFYGTIFLDDYFYGTTMKNISTSEKECEITGYIAPQTFTHNYPIKYTTYTGNEDLRYFFEDISRITICDVLDFFSWFLETYDLELTVADFGFYSF